MGCGSSHDMAKSDAAKRPLGTGAEHGAGNGTILALEAARKVFQKDWMPAVSSTNRQGWKKTCAMCGMYDGKSGKLERTPTSDGLMTYAMVDKNRETKHVIHMPTSETEDTVFKDIDEHAVKTPKSLSEDFASLVEHLTEPCTTELEKARVLFRWVTAQDIVNMQFPSEPKEDSPEWHLKEIKEKREFHSALFSQLCSHAGLEHEVVNGYTKGVRCLPGTALQGTDHRGSWTLVLLDNRWGIIDTSWGSHHMIDDDMKELEEVYSVEEFYFLPDPSRYIISHYPDVDNMQLLPKPISLPDFESHVKCWPDFFTYQLKLLSHHQGLLKTTNGEVTIYIGFRPEDHSKVKFAHHLKMADNGTKWRGVNLDRFVRQSRKKDAVKFVSFPPEKGDFLLDIFVGVEGEETNKFVCKYMISCTEALSDTANSLLPEWQGNWGPGNQALEKGVMPISHRSSTITCIDGRAQVEFALSRDLRFSAKLYENSIQDGHLLRNVAHEIRDGVVTFHIADPLTGNCGLVIYAQDASGEEKGDTPPLCSYIVKDGKTGIDPFPEVSNGLFGPIEPLFSQRGLSVRPHDSAFLETSTGEADIRILTERPLVWSHKLTWETAEEKIDFSNHVFRQTQEEEVQFWLRLPWVGWYRLAIFAEEFGHKGKLRNVTNYCIHCTGTKPACEPFPSVNGDQWGKNVPTFRDLKLSTDSHSDAYIPCRSREVEIRLSSSLRVAFLSQFRYQDKDMSDYMCVRSLDNGNKGAFLARLPENGQYCLEIFCKETDDEEPSSDVVNYLIICESMAPKNVRRFPRVSTACWGPVFPMFTEFHLQLVSHTDPLVVSNSGAIRLTFENPDNAGLTWTLNHWDNGAEKDCKNYCFVQESATEENRSTALALLPLRGYYKFSLYIKDTSTGDKLCCVVNYLFDCMSRVQRCPLLPRPLEGWRPEFRVDQPLTRILPIGETVRYKVKVPGATDVVVITSTGFLCHLKQTAEGHWEGQVTVPPDEEDRGKPMTLAAKFGKGDPKFSLLLEYRVGDSGSSVRTVLLETDQKGGTETMVLRKTVDRWQRGGVQTGLEEAYQGFLNRYESAIVADMDPAPVVPRLAREGILTEQEERSCSENVVLNQPAANRTVVGAVRREGEDAFLVFRDSLQDSAQVEIVKLLQDVIVDQPKDLAVRKKLQDAIRSRNRRRLLKAMEEYRALGLNAEDPVFKSAEKALEMLHVRQVLRDAIAARRRDPLERALSMATPFKDDLTDLLEQAELVIASLARLESLRHQILEMNQTTVSEIRSYAHPPPAVERVMSATFLLLGNQESDISDWKSLQALMGKTGQDSLKRRVQLCEQSAITMDKAMKAKLLLEGLDQDVVRDVSAGAAAFYIWVKGLIREVEDTAKA
ncbi:PREDICTED: LOW QUALITY PROTEIN: uncharacterized protein LOC109468031 [Branchiostoma belcheri]|uniref:LOW QUALITY PROTEIN: uncharacterized protein LOC109468031 n=1 Tax=Branchiostoma belcheri TaxID=7741 RepID=A0A6P4YX21_BRABE|nr:PREDICTED: LOW QUALITY PROTEIN: uncharacterized protein LOC109468031 [Branchiostoma belcheri]